MPLLHFRMLEKWESLPLPPNVQKLCFSFRGAVPPPPTSNQGLCPVPLLPIRGSARRLPLQAQAPRARHVPLPNPKYATGCRWEYNQCAVSLIQPVCDYCVAVFVYILHISQNRASYITTCFLELTYRAHTKFRPVWPVFLLQRILWSVICTTNASAQLSYRICCCDVINDCTAD